MLLSENHSSQLVSYLHFCKKNVSRMQVGSYDSVTTTFLCTSFIYFCLHLLGSHIRAKCNINDKLFGMIIIHKMLK